MSLIIGFIVSVVTSIFSFLLKGVSKGIKVELKRRQNARKKDKNKKSKKPVDIVRNKISIGNNKKGGSKRENKLTAMTDTALKLLLQGITAIKAFLQTLKVVIALLISFMVSLFMTGGIVIILTVVLLVCVISGSNGSSGPTVNKTSNGNKDDGFISQPISASVQEIIDMDEEHIWKLISESRFSSYQAACDAAKKNKSAEQQFWTKLMITIEVPIWKWEDASKTKKVESTRKVTINKYLADYFTSFMTELHNQPQKYVINELSGFCFRQKNNGDPNSNFSSHSFGTAIDINPSTKGMGSVPAKMGDGVPWNSDQGLSEPWHSEACAFYSNWFNVAKKYRLDWGGLWKSGSLDPMHFSVVGDRNKTSRSFQPQSAGQNPK